MTVEMNKTKILLVLL